MLLFDAIVAFVRLNEQCFSKQISDSGYVAELADYKKACSLLPVRKFHVKMRLIVAHLDRALPRETGRGLGADSEHALDAAHHDFLGIWQRFYVRDVSSPKYAERPLNAVVKYNASHTGDVDSTPFANDVRRPAGVIFITLL